MELGMIGLGRMGSNMTRRRLDLLDIHYIERSAFSDFCDLQRQIRLL